MERPDATVSDVGSTNAPKQFAHQAFLEDALMLGSVLASASPAEAGLKILVSELANKETSPSLSDIVHAKLRGESSSLGRPSFSNLFQRSQKDESITSMLMVGGVLKPTDIGQPKSFADFNRERFIAQEDLMRTLRREALLARISNPPDTTTKTKNDNSSERSDLPHQQSRTRDSSLRKK